MLIECSRCRAVFSLQDGVATVGARFKVQCGRCLAVFETVAAPRVSAAPAPAEPAPAIPAAPADAAATSAGDAAAAAPVPAPTPAGEASSTPAAHVHRPPARSRLLLGALAIALVAGVALYRRATSGDPEERVRQGRENLLLDDAKSLREATRLFTDVARDAPGQAEPEAERAFALLLQAGAHKDMARRVPPAQRDEEARAASRLLQQGAAAARQAMEDDATAPAAVRAMAFADALSGSAEPAGARAEQAERLAPGDPWVLYVKAVAAAAAGERDRAVQSLSAARQAQPRLLRADVDLAGIAMDGGDPAGARELLQRVLRENPQHDRARRMLSALPR